MTLFPVDDPDKVAFTGVLPAGPRPFVLGEGQGEKYATIFMPEFRFRD